MKIQNRSFFLTLIILSLSQINVISQQQSYYINKELQSAYQSKTRNAMGLPGAEYWQNRANYVIDAEVDPKSNSIEGLANIQYFNNSPDTLKRFVFNLYQDIFRKGNSRDTDVGADDLHDGTLISSLSIAGIEVDVTDKKIVNRQGTKLIVRLPQVVLPHSEVNIGLHWKVNLPAKRTFRMGKYNDSTFFVAYWYPQVAVYDDIDGWDMISYNGSVEFYNEFGDYSLSLRTPDDWAVWATGELLNPDAVFTKNILDKYNAAYLSDSVIKIITQEDYKKGEVLLAKKELTWKFSAKDVPDFSFAMGKGMLWDASSIIVDKKTKQRVFVGTAYPQHAQVYKNVALFSRQSIEYMSFTMPGVAFPYPTMTTFCNGRKYGGMETPMMANNGVTEDESMLFGLTFHEISHTYMPFMMGTNEKKYAWMDEGWASLWPSHLVESLYSENQYIRKTVENYENVAGKEMDIPPMVPNHLMAVNYSSLRLGSYVRPAMTYYFLEDVLGPELFRKALQYYMQIWKGKHPLPLDFIRIFEMVADQDLSWFFKPWLYENAYPDLSLKKVTDNGSVVVENRGGLPLPIELFLEYTDQTKDTIAFSAAVWSSIMKTIVIETNSEKHIREIKLGNELIPDVNRRDNYMLLIDQIHSK